LRVVFSMASTMLISTIVAKAAATVYPPRNSHRG